MNTESMRRDYAAGALRRTDLHADPLQQFERWFRDALGEVGVIEANAMTLATVDVDGRPHARIVLLKDVDSRGFRFFTNYESDKGLEIAARSEVALLFHWQSLERQVRIEGGVERVSLAESEAYFHSRPRASQIGAWASPQSRVVNGRLELESAFAECEKKFDGGEIPLPPQWGGYRVLPALYEFWQGRRSRLHDRFRYAPLPGGAWSIERLAP